MPASRKPARNGGTVSGGLRYTPASGYSGADSFSYTISDGRGGTATAIVSLTVQPPANNGPTAQGGFGHDGGRNGLRSTCWPTTAIRTETP